MKNIKLQYENIVKEYIKSFKAKSCFECEQNSYIIRST